jgi:hypothetical protein
MLPNLSNILSIQKSRLMAKDGAQQKARPKPDSPMQAAFKALLSAPTPPEGG